MEFDDNTFFTDNIAYVNRLVTNILYFTNLLGPLFYFLSKKGIFQINNTFCVITSISTFIFAVIQTFLVYIFGKKEFKNQ